MTTATLDKAKELVRKANLETLAANPEPKKEHMNVTVRNKGSMR